MPHRLEIALNADMHDAEGEGIRKKAEDYFGIHFEPDIDEELSFRPVLGSDLQEIITLDPALPFVPPSATTAITKWRIGPIRAIGDLGIHLSAIQDYCQRNPYGIYRLYLELAREIPLAALFNLYHALAPQERQFVDRDFSILSVEDAPIFRFRMDVLIAQSHLPKFSQRYLDTLRKYFLLDFEKEVGERYT
jgi:hypothetical protein